MKISQQATREHLIMGILLVALALAAAMAGLWLDARALPFLVFFFGVWGGVELGRHLEHSLTRASLSQATTIGGHS